MTREEGGVMENPRREAILRTLREDYGITTVEQLMDAIRNMKKLDITQFVYSEKKEGEGQCQSTAV